MTDSAPATDGAALARGAGQVTAANLVVGASNLLLLMLLTRVLARDDMAVVLLVYLVAEIVGVLGTLDLPSAMVYYVSRLPPSQARVVGLRTASWLMRGGIGVAAGLLLMTPFAGDLFAQPGVGAVLPWLAFGMLADLPGQALPGFLLARRETGAYLRSMLLYQGVRFFGMVVPAVLGAPVWVLVACFALASWVRLADLAHRLFILEKGDARPEGWEMRDLVRFSMPLMLSTLVGRLGVQFDKFLLSVIATPAAFSAYAVGAFELPLVSGVAYSVTNALMPELTQRHGKGDLDGARTLWHSAMVKVSAVMFPVFTFTVVMAEPIMSVLFSKDYADAATPFRVIACLLPLRLCGYGAISRSLGQSRPVLHGSIAAAVVNLSLAWPLYMLLGLAGPALATILGQATAIGVLLFAIRRALGCPFGLLLPLLPLGRTFVVAGVAGAATFGTLLFGLPDAVTLCIGAVVHLGLYLVLGRKSGVLSSADLRYFTGLMPRFAQRWTRS